MRTLSFFTLAIVLLGSVPRPIFAREVKFDKKVDPGALQTQLIAAGFKVNYIECSTTRCKIILPDSEKKNPLPEVQKYIYVDPQEVRAKKMAMLLALYDKWEAGAISNEEKDHLIRSTLGIVLGR